MEDSLLTANNVHLNAHQLEAALLTLHKLVCPGPPFSHVKSMGFIVNIFN